MLKKIFCVLMVCGIVISTVVWADKISFTDVENHWAKNEIYKMVEKKVILGMGDGTFAPNNQIIKSHAFLMFSRLMGFYDLENEEVIKEATNEYSLTLKENGINQGISEISFLIKTEIISMEDIIDILGNGKETQKLSRQEAAYIFVKLLNDEGKLNQFISEIFADTKDIDDKYIKYVEYVRNIELMLGMDEKNFEPNGYVTRAQVATILCRIDNILYGRSLTEVKGEIQEINKVYVTLLINEKQEKYYMTKDTVVYKGEDIIDLSELKNNDIIQIFVRSNGIIDRIYLKNTEKNIYAIFDGYDVNTDTKELEKIYILQNNKQYSFEVSEDIIVKDGKKVIDVDDILKGENIEVYILNDKIKQINIGKVNYKEKGMIEQIIIGKQNYLTIHNLKGESLNYELLDNTIYDFDGAEGNIYDLRLDMDVELTITNEGVQKVKVETLTNIEILTGVVQKILPKIYVFTIKDADGQLLMMFLDEEETVIKTKNGVAKDIEDINQGDTVSIYGRYEGEVFYPIQVIIYNEEV